MISKFIRKNIDTVILNKDFACKTAIYKNYRTMGCDSLARKYIKGVEVGIKYTEAAIWRLEDEHNNLLPFGKEGTVEEITELASCMADATMAIESPTMNEGFNDGMTLVIKAYEYLITYEVYYQIGLLSEASRNKLIQPTKKSEAVHI